MKEGRIKNLKENMVLLLIKGLSEGKTERDMHREFKANNVRPSSLESIDLYLIELRRRNKCKTTFQLMYNIGRGMKLKIND